VQISSGKVYTHRSLVFFVHQLLVVEEKERLGSDGGADSIKRHPWFVGLDWEGLLECHVNVPNEIMSRLEVALESHHMEESHYSMDSNNAVSLEELNSPLWLDDW
jgi:hypothetical protein